MIDGDQYMVIEQDPANKKSIPILRSNNENEGIEFTWSVWLMIEDYQRTKTNINIFSTKEMTKFLVFGRWLSFTE